MSPLKLPFALIAFLTFVGVMPAWIWFVQNETTGLSPEETFLVTLILPATAALYLVSWLQPRGGSQ